MQVTHFECLVFDKNLSNEKNGTLGTNPSARASASDYPSLRRPWILPAQGLAVFHGPGNTARLSHYFLPRLLMEGKRVLFLDGANSADPRLLERLARERGVAFREFSRRIEIARAFTCFQLTELIARLPRFLAAFPAEVLIVTALPDLYFDEDVRDGDARLALAQALQHLRHAPTGSKFDATAPPLAMALFSSAESFAPSPARRRFFTMTCAAATEVWRFDSGEDRRPKLICERAASSRGRPTESNAPAVKRAKGVNDGPYAGDVP